MFLSAIVLALLVGALAGGGLPRLADLRLRWLWLLGLALAVRLIGFAAPTWGIADQLPLGAIFIGAYILIFAWLWGNWHVPGLQVAAVGIGLNTLAVIFNAGRMPVWTGALNASGLTPDQLGSDPFHFLMSATSVADFVRRGGIFGDVVPFPVPVIRDVVSIGDLLLAMGIFWAIVSSMTRPDAPVRAGVALTTNPLRPTTGGEFQTGVAYAGAFATPELAPGAPIPTQPMRALAGAPAAGVGAGSGGAAIAVPRARAQSPYLRLARNANFSLFWVGQLVSLFGDRVHQLALAFLVASRFSPLDVGITFAMTAVPNVVLGPLAGALADRWDRRISMIGCDVVRAGLVLLVPAAADINIGLVYAIAFAVSAVSIVFRPAKNAIVPLIVAEDELVTANSATTVTETLADLIGYPVAGLLVATLGGMIAAAFVIDSATYVVSALLLWSMAVARSDAVQTPFSIGAIWQEMVDGWLFLRRQAELFANTLVSTFAQVVVGAEIVCSVLYAKNVLDQARLPYPENYSLLMASIGLGSIVGGVAIGAIADRLPKGPMSIAGYVSFGLCFALTAFVRDPFLAIGVFFLAGATNMVFLIPTITLFQERTPQRLMGRVVSTRQAIVFGVMAASMGAAGWLSGVPGFGPQTVLALGGVVCAVAGLGGLLVPAMRRAR
jgi:MFS transporter, DHA3 family, macrolide efflux protein